MSSDIYKTTNSPRRKAAAIVPDDNFDMKFQVSGIWVGTAGNLTVIPAGNDDASPVTFANVPVGEFKSVNIRRVLATGTSATGLIGMI